MRVRRLRAARGLSAHTLALAMSWWFIWLWPVGGSYGPFQATLSDAQSWFTQLMAGESVDGNTKAPGTTGGILYLHSATADRWDIAMQSGDVGTLRQQPTE